MLDLTNPIYTDNAAAIKHFEAIHWPDGSVCPHCACVGNSVELKGKSTRPGLWKCRDCRKPFTAMMGTVYESSHIPMNLWLLATHLMCASKKSMSALQLQRMLNLKSYRSAWFMAHRIREAMTHGGELPPLGSGGGVVEVDETYIGNKKGAQKRGGYRHKHAVLTLVERGGESRSFHVDSSSAKDVMPIIRANIAKEAFVMTDEGKQSF